MLKLYWAKGSIYAQRVMVALNEKKVACELLDASVLEPTGDKVAPAGFDFFGRVPVLEDDGFLLSESLAILQYVEAKFPTPPLFPQDARSRARVSMFLSQCDIELGLPLGRLLQASRPGEKQRGPEAAAQSAQAVERHLVDLGRQIGDRSFLLGDVFSIVEVAYAPLLLLLDKASVPVPAVVRPWVTRVCSWPSVTSLRGSGR